MEEGSTEDADAMRRAFESFMMSGGSAAAVQATSTSGQVPLPLGKKKKKKNSGRRTAGTDVLSQRASISLLCDEDSDATDEEKEDEARMAYAQEQRLRKWEKRAWAIFHKFADELKDTWLEIDGQIEQIVKSIAGIRSRLPMHAKLFDRFDRESKKKDLNFQSGYRHSLFGIYEETSDEECYQSDMHRIDLSQTLNRKDVELAMSHDLIQHEKMMEGLRSLFSVLSESVDTLSRHLDESLRHQFDSGGLIIPPDVRPSFLKASHLSEVMTDLFHMISLETYRKQCLAHKIFETVVDAVMEKNGTESNRETLDLVHSDWNDLGPRGVVDRCSLLWSRNCNHSEIDLTILHGVLDAARASSKSQNKTPSLRKSP